MRLREDSGQTLVFVALGMTVLVAFMGLAIDVGLLLRSRRNMQIAADAAAIAAALDYRYNSSTTSAKAAGQAAATVNGVTNGTGGATVTINIPPVYGPYAGDSGFIEAIVLDPSPTIFMGVLSKKNSLNVGARAVAGSGSNVGCIWTLAKSGTDVSLTGSGSITASNCDIYDDSSSASSALTLTGSGAITAKEVGIVGGYTRTGSGSISPIPVTGIAPAADPLASLAAPSIPTGTCSSNCTQSNTGSGNLSLNQGTYTSISNTGSGTLTLNPGNYIITGDLTNTGSGSLILGAGNYTIGGNFKSTGSSSLTLGSGLYIIGGNLQLTGSGSMTGSSITFYTQGATTLTGSGNMNLSAPTSGPYSGILAFQARSDSSTMAITGSGGDHIQGILYAPSAPLTLTGSGSLNVSLDLIADSLTETGSGSIVDTNYSVVTNPNSVLSRLALVE
ncbi:pilus assembly protein TadG-related protein [Telmatobacter sp. DSM 110680]|uniref:Pilus assembly protein TadG-related protein n=1 Tax=Telmatobacter sp. DSM 110680 TaxID=3036704 RepID=A0AAU7DIA7_9BACT